MLDGLAYLLGQLPAGAHDQTVGALPTGEGQPGLLLQTEHDQGQHVHQRLPTPGVRDPDEVPAAEHCGDPLHLDRTRLLDVLVSETIEDARIKLHVLEGLQWWGRTLTVHIDTIFLPDPVMPSLGESEYVPGRPKAGMNILQ